MKSSVIVAAACAAIAVAVLAGEPAGAANAWGGSYCSSDKEGVTDCGFTSLAQCQASASGTSAGCYAAPPWAGLPQQGAYAPSAMPQGRGMRAGR